LGYWAQQFLILLVIGKEILEDYPAHTSTFDNGKVTLLTKKSHMRWKQTPLLPIL